MNSFQLKMVDRAKDNLQLLDDWQKGFIGSLVSLSRLPEGVDLTDSQNKKLNEINTKLMRSLC